MRIEHFTVIDNLSDSLWRWQRNNYSRYYLLSGYSNNPECNHILDSMACDFIKNSKVKELDRTVTFFKKSHITNNEKMLENDRYFDRYSLDHDLLFTYSGNVDSLGGNLGKSYKAGESIIQYEYLKDKDSLLMYKASYKRNLLPTPLKGDEINQCFLEIVLPKYKK
ncbi:MAG: hypothetical protein J5I59_13505 [Saprospiraceae bacterium]|nr:hypothetical protein [Saprospiraceae bacterium]